MQIIFVLSSAVFACTLVRKVPSYFAKIIMNSPNAEAKQFLLFSVPSSLGRKVFMDFRQFCCDFFGHPVCQISSEQMLNPIIAVFVQDRKVYGHVLAAFRYGREDLDVLGLTFRKVKK